MQIIKNPHSIANSTFAFNFQRTKQSIPLWLEAWRQAENIYYPRKYRLIECYDMAMIDAHLSAVVETRKAKVLGEAFVVLNEKNEVDNTRKNLFMQRWFSDFVNLSLDSIAWGFTLIELNFDQDNKIFVREVDRRNLVEQTQEVLFNTYDTAGICYTDRGIRDFYIPIKSRYALGLLNKAIYWTIFKRLSVGSQATFNENFGLPMLLAKSDKDPESKKQLMKTLLDLGKERIAVVGTDEDLQVVYGSATTDGSKNFEAMNERANSEISKLFLGDVKTTDNAGSQAYINVDVANKSPLEERKEMDMEFVEGIINEELIPRLALFGFDVKGLRFRYLHNYMQDKNRNKTTIQPEIFKTLLENYQIPAQWVADNLGVPVVEKQEIKQTQQTISQRLGEKKKPFEFIVQNTENPEIEGSEDFEKIFEELLQDLYDNFEQNKQNVFNKIQTYNYQNLVKGLQVELDFKTQDKAVLKSLRSNLWYFSGAKSYQMTKELSALLINNETNTRRTFAEFKPLALAVNNTYNRTHLSAEYELAISTSQTISQWQALTKNNPKQLITYSAVGDKRTTQVCNRLNGITRPADDDFWNSFTPPNHWRCRSTIKAGNTQTEVPENLDKPDKMFNFNPAKTNSVFHPSHPYFEDLPKEVKQSIKKTTPKK